MGGKDLDELSAAPGPGALQGPRNPKFAKRLKQILEHLVLEYFSAYIGIIKTSVDIPDNELQDAIRFTRARTKREAIVTAIAEFNRRHRMAELVKRAGSCAELMTVEELRQNRRRG